MVPSYERYVHQPGLKFFVLLRSRAVSNASGTHIQHLTCVCLIQVRPCERAMLFAVCVCECMRGGIRSDLHTNIHYEKSQNTHGDDDGFIGSDGRVREHWPSFAFNERTRTHKWNYTLHPSAACSRACLRVRCACF